MLKVLHELEVCGFYARVGESGRVTAGDPVMLRNRPQSTWCIKRLHQLMFHGLTDGQLVEEAMSVTLRFPHDRLASFTVSFGAADINRYIVVGTKGYMAADPAYMYSTEIKLHISREGQTEVRTFPKRDQFAEVVCERGGLRAQFRHHGAEQHRSATRLQRVLGPHQQRRRRAAAGALQRRQHFDHFRAARLERGANLLLARIERTQSRLGIADAVFDDAHLVGDVDQLRGQLAAILSDCGDVGAQFGLLFGCTVLLGAGGLEFLGALLDRLRRGCGILQRRRLCGGWRETRRGNEDREREAGEPAADEIDIAMKAPCVLHLLRY